jgi:hypothetical protein
MTVSLSKTKTINVNQCSHLGMLAKTAITKTPTMRGKAGAGVKS